jgi:hypothetical protein
MTGGSKQLQYVKNKGRSQAAKIMYSFVADAAGRIYNGYEQYKIAFKNGKL